MTLKEIDLLFENLASKDDKVRYPSFIKLQEITDSKVKWIYTKWFMLVEKLSSENSYQRTIGLTLLANLCKNDHEQRIANIIDEYLNHFNDEKFITARLCIQSVWKIAVTNNNLRRKIIDSLENSYRENIHLKTHPNLIRQDIVDSLEKIMTGTKDERVKEAAARLIAEETDEKVIKKLKNIVK